MRIHQAPCKLMKVGLRFCIFFLCGKKINLHIWRRECHPNFIIQVSLSDLDSLMIRRMSQACVWQACDECHKHACKACNAGANGKALIILHWLNGRHGEKQARSRNAKREGRGEEQVCTRRKKWQERLRLPSYFPARRFNPFHWMIDWCPGPFGCLKKIATCAERCLDESEWRSIPEISLTSSRNCLDVHLNQM